MGDGTFAVSFSTAGVSRQDVDPAVAELFDWNSGRSRRSELVLS